MIGPYHANRSSFKSQPYTQRKLIMLKALFAKQPDRRAFHCSDDIAQQLNFARYVVLPRSPVACRPHGHTGRLPDAALLHGVRSLAGRFDRWPLRRPMTAAHRRSRATAPGRARAMPAAGIPLGTRITGVRTDLRQQAGVDQRLRAVSQTLYRYLCAANGAWPSGSSQETE